MNSQVPTPKNFLMDIGVLKPTDDGPICEEYFISDVESDYELPKDFCKHTSYEYLNEYAERLEDLDEEEILAYETYLSDYPCSDVGEDALNKAESGDYRIWYARDYEELGEQIIELDYPNINMEHSPNLLQYFDFESFGKDSFLDGSFTQNEERGVFVEWSLK